MLTKSVQMAAVLQTIIPHCQEMSYCPSSIRVILMSFKWHTDKYLECLDAYPCLIEYLGVYDGSSFRQKFCSP